MDLTRATRLMSRLIEVDQSVGVSRNISNLRQRMDQLISNPTDPATQTGVVEATRELRQALAVATELFSPEELANASELVRLAVFDPGIVNEFEKSLAANVATPAAARDLIAAVERDRSAKLELMHSVTSAASDLGWASDEANADWDAEVGFKIPREIFSNEFDRLIGEFRFLKRFLSNVAEVEGQSISDVQLASLSTTDPLVVLGVAVVIAERVGKIAKWGLDCWKTVEEIRKLREETRKLKSFTDEEVESIFGDKIRAEIDTAIELKSKELTAGVKDKGRRNELENSFSMYLKEFLGRIERGMTVEIRLLASPPDDVEAEDAATAAEFAEVAASLAFPPASPDPVLQITQQDGG